MTRVQSCKLRVLANRDGPDRRNERTPPFHPRRERLASLRVRSMKQDSASEGQPRMKSLAASARKPPRP